MEPTTDNQLKTIFSLLEQIEAQIDTLRFAIPRLANELEIEIDARINAAIKLNNKNTDND